jgi:hypothetical protein
VSIELPGWVADAFNLIGLPWPGIDEDQLRAWAGGLRAYAAEITALSGSSRSAVAALAASDDSSFARTLAAQWEHHHALISDLRGPMEVFAGALDVAAAAVEAQKVVVIGAAVVLAGEVIATQGEALVTFGLAEAEVPAEVAIARLAVKAALQELEGQLLGLLINKAAGEISALVGGTVGKLISGGGQVAAEAVTLTADYQAMRTLSGALSGHAGRVEQASAVSWRKAGSGSLEEGGPGGGWREVARAVEQTVLQVLKQLFVDLGHALWRIITDTIAFLKKAIAALRHTDDTLAADARRAADGGVGGGPPGSGYQYNMIENPGPLAEMDGTPAANFAGGRYNEVTLGQDTTLYRGGESGKPLGQWFTSGKPQSVAQVRIDTAVKPEWIDPKTGASMGSSPVDTVYEVKIPAGTKIYPGPTANQGGVYVGGTEQIFVPKPWTIPGVEVTGSEPLK